MVARPPPERGDTGASASSPAGRAVVEVRYLYAFAGSGHLYQPVYLGARDDLDATDCLASQLKFKAAPEAAA